MAKKVQLKLDHAGIASILKGAEVGKVVDEAGSRVAALAGGEVMPFTTDRRISIVRVEADRQARDGALTQAASAAGLEVTEIKLYTTKSGKTRRATQAQIDNWTRGRRS